MLKIHARKDGLTGMIQALAKAMFQARLRPGCIESQIYAQTASPRSLLYVEQWETQEDLDCRIRSQEFHVLLATMEAASEPPCLEIRTVSRQQGLEYIESLRLAHATN